MRVTGKGVSENVKKLLQVLFRLVLHFEQKNTVVKCYLFFAISLRQLKTCDP